MLSDCPRSRSKSLLWLGSGNWVRGRCVYVEDSSAVGDRRRWECAWRVEIGVRIWAMTVAVVWCLAGVVSPREIAFRLIRACLMG